MSESESDVNLTVDESPDHAIQRDRALTLPRKRLAGSPACLNCGTPLKGPFCYYCGQPDRNFMRFFPVLLRELMSDILEFDSRFMRTMKPLLFKPGRLTRDYLEGRRYRYTPPLRLYLFSSIVFFIVAALLSSNAVRESIGDFSASSEQLTEQQAEAGEEEEESRPRWFNIDGIQFNDQPWDAESNPVDLPWVPQRIDDWINAELKDSPTKAEEINRDPDVIIDQVFDILPATVFVLLPIVALLFKFWYLFARRYYIEHLIFALHNHSFLFVALLLILLSVIGMDWAEVNSAATFGRMLNWFLIAVAVWIPLYLFISLRTVYRQNWFLTFFKFGAIGICYVTLLVGLTVLVAVLSFLLL
jgi:hypothetical protein